MSWRIVVISSSAKYLELKENYIQEIVIESPKILSAFVSELYEQCQGGEGEFVFSQNNSLLSIKKVSFIMEPFSINCNNKTILGKLYQDLEKMEYKNGQQEWSTFYGHFVTYMDKICENTEVSITYDEMIGIQEVLKLAKVKIDTEASTLVEKIWEYIFLENQLLGTKIFIFLNLKMFLTQGELEQLYQECFYKKIYLVLIETNFQKKLDTDNVCIIDKDQCIIYI